MAINFNIQSVNAGGPVQAGRVDASSGFNAIAGGFLNLARGIAQFQQVGKEAENEAAAVNLFNKTKQLLHQKYNDIDQETSDPRIRFNKRNEVLEQTVTRSFEQAQKRGFPSSFSKLSTKWFSKEQGDLIEEFDSREASFSLQTYTNSMNNEYLPAFDRAHAGGVITTDPETGIQRFELPLTEIKNLSSISDRMRGELGRALDSNDPDKVNKVVTGFRKTAMTAQAKQFAVMSARDPDLDLTDLVFNTEVLVPRVDIINGEGVVTYARPTDAEIQDRAQQAFSFAAQNESRIQFQENQVKAQKQEFADSFRAGLSELSAHMVETGDFSMLSTIREDLQQSQHRMTFDDREDAWNKVRNVEKIMREGAEQSDPVTLSNFESRITSKERFPFRELENAFIGGKLAKGDFRSLVGAHRSMFNQAETDFERAKNASIKIVDGLFSTPTAQVVIGDKGGAFTSVLRRKVDEKIGLLGTTALDPTVARKLVFESAEDIIVGAIAGGDESFGISRQEFTRWGQILADVPVGESPDLSVQRIQQDLATRPLSTEKRISLKFGLSIIQENARLKASGALPQTLGNRPALSLTPDPKAAGAKDDQTLKQSRTIIQRKRPALNQYDEDVERIDRELQEAVSIVSETQEAN